MERTENEKIMQKKRMNKKENWALAQKQAQGMARRISGINYIFAKIHDLYLQSFENETLFFVSIKMQFFLWM